MEVLFDLSRLPLELLPSVVSWIDQRQDLCNLALTNRKVNQVATERLYRWIRMFGKDIKVVSALFDRLSSSPFHCQLVRKLEIRVYPFSNQVEQRFEMEEKAIRVLEYSTNLEHLIWTRKGALTDR